MDSGPQHISSQPSNPQPQATQPPAVLQPPVQLPGLPAMLPAAQPLVPQSSTLPQPPLNSPSLAFQFRVQGAGPPLVLVQGFPFDSSIWSGITPYLSAEYTVHTWDMPIRGIPSPSVNQRFMLSEQSSNLRTMLNRQFGDKPVIVIAHGVGAFVALHAHVHFNSPFHVLILVNPITEKWAIPFFNPMRGRYKSFEAMHPRLHGVCVRELMSSASRGALHANLFNRLISPWTGSFERQLSFYDQAQAVRRCLHSYPSRVNHLYNNIKSPEHICMGQYDEWAGQQQMGGLWDRFRAAGEQQVACLGAIWFLWRNPRRY